MKTPKSLNVEVSSGDQNVHFTEILETPGHKLRIRIRSNAYRFQSWAIIERWDGAKWQEVATVHHGKMQTREALYVARSVSADDFAADRASLLRLAVLVLA